MADDRTLWTFASTCTFYRVLDGDTWPPWFDEAPVYSRDTVLGATQASDSYLDKGAVGVEPLTIRGEFTSSSAREAAYALRYTSGTLSNAKGYSGTATMTGFRRVESGMSGVFWADMSFDLR